MRALASPCRNRVTVTFYIYLVSKTNFCIAIGAASVNATFNLNYSIQFQHRIAGGIERFITTLIELELESKPKKIGIELNELIIILKKSERFIY